MATETKLKPRSLQTSWGTPVDTDGLNETDRRRIREVGFDRWMEEMSREEKGKRPPCGKRDDGRQ